jgi:AcrR family transcriptional regulator
MSSGHGAAPSQARGRARGPSCRPLDRAKDQAITAAVVDVLARLGYSGFTMDEVALAAGVGKAAIYRRWSSKTDLLVSYTEESIEGTLDVSDTGSLRNDLVVLLRSAVVHFNGPAGRANRALLSAVHDDPMLAAAYHAGPMAQWTAAFREIFDRAARRGEIGPAVAWSVAAETGAAIVVQRWLLWGAHIDEALVTAVVDDVVPPIGRTGARGADVRTSLRPGPPAAGSRGDSRIRRDRRRAGPRRQAARNRDRSPMSRVHPPKFLPDAGGRGGVTAADPAPVPVSARSGAR